jgi:Cu2+-exporting ATPase
MTNIHESVGECNYLAGMECPACEHEIDGPSKFYEETQQTPMDSFQQSYIEVLSPLCYRAHYIISGLRCGGCVSQCEQLFSKQAGVEQALVHFDSKELHITYNPQVITAHTIEDYGSSQGFDLRPFTTFGQTRLLEAEEKTLLSHIGVAGLTMMPVMMASIALYYGVASNMSATVVQSIKLVILLATTAACLYSAQSFFRGCMYALKAKTVTMDVTITLALVVAYGISVYNSVYDTGSTYFESLLMLVFIILISRFCELKIRQENSKNLLRDSAKKQCIALKQKDSGEYLSIAIDHIQVNDVLSIRQGDYIPADGIVQADCLIDESAFTGESTPLKKMKGEKAYHGTYNRGHAFTLLVTETVTQSRLANINRLADAVLKEKPRIVKQADRIASYFLSFVLVLCVVATIIWWQIDASAIPQVILALLVAACPCALSIATPAAISQVINLLRKNGILINRHDAVEKLAKVQQVFFDKTGTLTTLESGVSQLQVSNDYDAAFVVGIASALEENIIHPVAIAIHTLQQSQQSPQQFSAEAITYHQGLGITGTVEGKAYFFGRYDYIASQINDQTVTESQPKYDETPLNYTVFLANSREIIGQFVFKESIVEGTEEAIRYLTKKHIDTAIISGDSTDKVRDLANQLGIQNAQGEMSASDKLKAIDSAQYDSLMIGDGNNDYPAQSKSFLSVALAHSPDISKVNADIVLLKNNLGQLPLLLETVSRGHTILKQGFIGSIIYNGIALTLAFSGVLTPLVAALGMSLSSLLVVGNTLRIQYSTLNVFIGSR